MGKNKLKRFAENKTFSNVLEPLTIEKFPFKGCWAKDFFKNSKGIILELGCGKGEYLLELAEQKHDKNFIGIDIKGARFWQGAKQALEKDLKNIAFLRTRIEWIENFFAPGEIEEIWITFPDPQIKNRRAKHRLTHKDFLEKYRRILKAQGLIHLKTDSEFLYGYTHGVLACEQHPVRMCSHDIYRSGRFHLPPYVSDIQTFYEKSFIKEGKPIAYLQFQLKAF